MTHKLNFERAIEVLEAIETIERWNEIYNSPVFHNAVKHLEEEQIDTIVVYGINKLHDLTGDYIEFNKNSN